MKTILSEKELDFNTLEKEIFRIGCEYAASLMEEVLKQMDKQLAESRDKKTYRHKGSRATTLKTLMGEVTYDRTVYETTLETGEKACVYLLDEVLKMATFGKVTRNLATRIAESVSVCSYRETADKVSSMKVEEVEKAEAQKAEKGEGKGEITTAILFEEADGVWINMQGKDRPENARKREMKMAVAYDGWEKESERRYSLRNKIMVCGFEDAGSFQKKKEGAIASVFNTDEIEIRILNGDGGEWIKGGLVDEDVHFQLDPFHKNREILRKVKNVEQRKIIHKLLSEKRIAELLQYLRWIGEQEEEPDEQKKLLKLYQYFRSNQEGLIPYQERGLKLPSPPVGVEYRNLGTMEHHVCDGAAKRMKHQKASWSKQGASNLGRILCKKVCGKLHQAVTSLSKVELPERYTQEIEEILSAAKAPKTDGQGYLYPVRGGKPFNSTFVTNGRKAIINLLNDRVSSELIYR